MEIEEVLKREGMSYEMGVKVGVLGVLLGELIVGGVILIITTLIRVWF